MLGNQAAQPGKSSANSEICLTDWLRLALLDFRVTLYKFDWSICNQAVQNSEINILPRVSQLTVSLKMNLVYYMKSLEAEKPASLFQGQESQNMKKWSSKGQKWIQCCLL